jgi:hypothetical protein
MLLGVTLVHTPIVPVATPASVLVELDVALRDEDAVSDVLDEVALREVDDEVLTDVDDDVLAEVDDDALSVVVDEDALCTVDDDEPSEVLDEEASRDVVIAVEPVREPPEPAVSLDDAREGGLLRVDEVPANVDLAFHVEPPVVPVACRVVTEVAALPPELDPPPEGAAPPAPGELAAPELHALDPLTKAIAIGAAPFRITVLRTMAVRNIVVSPKVRRGPTRAQVAGASSTARAAWGVPTRSTVGWRGGGRATSNLCALCPRFGQCVRVSYPNGARNGPQADCAPRCGAGWEMEHEDTKAGGFGLGLDRRHGSAQQRKPDA